MSPKAAARLGLKLEDQAQAESAEFLDNARMEQDFGWRPRFDTIDGILGDYVTWLRDHAH